MYRKLVEWKESSNRKPLLLLGARQVGKTWLMREFGEKEYETVVYINCDDEPLTRELFAKDYDIDRLLIGFQAISGKTIKEDSTLIILDELQEAPRGIHSLKYFQEKAPGYHIMAAGSLLGVTLAGQESFPVGKVDMLHLYPMDFEEYLMACGENQLCRLLKSGDHQLADTFSTRLTELLRQYYFVGGMPEVVSSFVKSKDLAEVRRLQSDIMEAYRKDISKHSSKRESVRIGQVLASMPSQLSKENKKFIYGVARPGARAADFELAIQWLIDAGLVYKVPRLTKVAMPLSFYEDCSAFKLFFIDVGLLGCISGISASALLLEPESLVEFRGMMAEEYVCQQLIACARTPYYWSNDKTPAELDFVVSVKDRPVPIEVKASTNVRSRSLSQFLKDNPGLKGLRFSLAGFREQERLTNWPLYEVPFIMGDDGANAVTRLIASL